MSVPPSHCVSFQKSFTASSFSTSSFLLSWIWCWAVHSKQMCVLEVASRSLLAHKECQWIGACQTSEVNEMMCSRREKKKSLLGYCSSKKKLFLQTEVYEIQNGWEDNKAVLNFLKRWKNQRTSDSSTANKLMCAQLWIAELQWLFTDFL